MTGMERLNDQPVVRKRRSDRYAQAAAQPASAPAPIVRQAATATSPQPTQPTMVQGNAKPVVQQPTWQTAQVYAQSAGGYGQPTPPAAARPRTVQPQLVPQNQQTAPRPPQSAYNQAAWQHPAQYSGNVAPQHPVQPQGKRATQKKASQQRQPVQRASKPVPKQSTPKTQAQKRASSAPKRKPPKSGSPTSYGYRVVVALVAVVLLVVIVVVAVQNQQATQARQALAAEVHTYDNLFCEGVYVDGIDLGGMTQQQATDAVVQQAQQKRDAWSVRLTLGNQYWELTAGQLGISINLSEAMDSAWAQGHEGTDEERKAAMDALKAQPFHAYTSLPGGDTSVVDSLLQQIAQEVYTPAEDAYVVSFDASLTNPFTFHEETVGRTLNADGLKERIYQMISTMTSGELALDDCVTYTYPSVTVDLLKHTQVAERYTAYTKISSTSTANRNDNISLAMEKINGTVLHPGETFSFNDIVGARTVSNGFKEAIEYVSGQEVNGIGGGVCQASTTVYQAALLAGMEIVDRSPHGMAVGYSEYGMDATVYWSSGRKIDFKFRNNTDSDIYIKTNLVLQGKTWYARCTLYGVAMAEGESYNFIIDKQILPAPVEEKVVMDKDGTYVQYVDDEPYVYQEAKNGLEVTSYQGHYLNGEEIERIYIDKDVYKAKQRIVYYGVKERE